MRFDDKLLRPSENNLTLVRLIFASAVIYTHSYYPLADHDDLLAVLGAPVSNYAVDGFFVLSGFLVYRSITRNGSIRQFAASRFTRLWPGLAAHVLLVVLAGAFITRVSPGAYLTGQDTLRFLFGNLTFSVGGYRLSGITCGDAPCVINGSLWTLPWEARCYLFLAALALAGLANRKAMFFFVLPLTFIFAIGWDVLAVLGRIDRVAAGGIVYYLNQIDRLWTAFALGIAVYELRRHIPLSWLGLAALFTATVAVGWWLPTVHFHFRLLLVAYLALCIGFLAARGGSISGSWPDYSYGMYIYAYPVMMAIISLFPGLPPHLLALADVVLTLPFAAVSWHLVEKPALNALRRWRRERARNCDSDGATMETTAPA